MIQAPNSAGLAIGRSVQNKVNIFVLGERGNDFHSAFNRDKYCLDLPHERYTINTLVKLNDKAQVNFLKCITNHESKDFFNNQELSGMWLESLGVGPQNSRIFRKKFLFRK